MVNHHCAEIERQIPSFLRISKPTLEKVILCHQEESLWPFSDPVALKNIFDELFETDNYAKIVEGVW